MKGLDYTVLILVIISRIIYAVIGVCGLYAISYCGRIGH